MGASPEVGRRVIDCCKFIRQRGAGADPMRIHPGRWPASQEGKQTPSWPWFAGKHSATNEVHEYNVRNMVTEEPPSHKLGLRG